MSYSFILELEPSIKNQLVWPDHDYKQLVIELIERLSLKAPTLVKFSPCHGGRSEVTVFKIAFESHSHLDKVLIIRSHSNQESAQSELQRANELQVNSKDCFLNVCNQLPLLLANHPLVVYEDVATNLVAENTQSLCESVVDYLSATQDRETFAKNFQAFVQAITKSYEEVQAYKYEGTAGKSLFQDLSTLKELTNLTTNFTNTDWLSEPLRNMGFEEGSLLTVNDCQRLCQTLESVRTYPRHTDLHCGNVLVANNSFKLIDVGDMAKDLAAADVARLEVSLWFQLTQANHFSKEEAEEIVRNLTVEESKWSSASPKVLAFTWLLHSLRQGFRAGSALKDLPAKEIELAYLLQILRYQRYWCNDKVSQISPALNVFVKSQLRPWKQQLGQLPPEVPKLRVCEGQELTELKQRLVQVLAMPEPPVPKVPRDNWPFPIQAALNRLRQSVAAPLQDYFNVFEAFVHFHFVALGSQFYWAVTPAWSQAPAIKTGLDVLHQALLDAYGEGSTAWVQRNAILSVASQALPASSLPFPQLITVQTEEVNLWLTDLAQLRKQIGNYEGIVLPPEFAKSLTGLATRLRAIFQPYHGLHLAMVTEDDAGGRGIHCYWQETKFLCKTNVENYAEMTDIWQESSPNLLNAPNPPRADWQWDESLVLCDIQQPYQRYLYLMPLGAKYSHRDVSSQESWPGLLDSVRWHAKDSSVVIQKHYQSWQGSKAEGVQKQPVNQAVETLVKELVEKFGFASPVLVEEDSRDAHFSPFDLQHGKLIALPQAIRSVWRQAEVTRILAELRQAPARRLLLEGASGSGKSVLLAQLYQQEETRRRVVFVSLDAGNLTSSANESEAAGIKDSTGLRVLMYCVAVLTQAPLQMLLPLEELQRQLRQVATQRAGEEEWLIIIDGLNQAVDPGNITGSLPDPLPENVSVVASSQPQARVWEAITRYGHESWECVKLDKLSAEEAQKIVHYYWTVPVAHSTSPAFDALPSELVAQLVEKSQGLPVLLEGWTQRLRELWQVDADQFAHTALLEFNAHAHEWLPAFLHQRLKAAQQEFQPAPLLEALLWSLSLIPKGLTVKELVDCLQALRQLTELAEFAQLPPVSKSDIEEGLLKLSGFLRKIVGGEDRWQLSHEVVGTWFVDYKGKREWLPKVRLSLVRLGAIPLPEKASKEEFAQWLEWVITEDEHPLNDLYETLSPEQQIGILGSLFARCSKHSVETVEYAEVLVKLVEGFLSDTGEPRRAFDLEKFIHATLQHHLPLATQASLLTALGDIQLAQNKLDQALSYFERALVLRQQVLAGAMTPKNRYQLVAALYQIGSLYSLQNRLDLALKYFEENLASMEQMVAESPTPRNQRSVAGIVTRMGDIYITQNRLEDALRAYKRALEIFEVLLAKSATPFHRNQMARISFRIGNLHIQQNQLDKALEYYQRALRLFEKLYADTPIPANLSDLAGIWSLIGDLYQAKNDLDQALTCFQRGKEMLEQLHTAAPTPQTARDLAVSWSWLGGLYQAKNDLDQALTYFQRYQEMFEQLHTAAPTPQTARDLAVSWGRLGDVYQAKNDLDQALTCFQRGKEMFEQLHTAAPTPQTARELAVSWNRLGGVYEAKNDLDQALTCFQRSQEMSEQLHTAAPTPQTARELAVSWGRLGKVYEAKNDLDQALTCFQRTSEMFEQLHTAAPIPQTQLDVAVACNRLGIFYFNQNQFHQALPYFERYLQLSEQLLAAADIPSLRREVEVARQCVADTRERLVAGEGEVRFVNSSRVDKSRVDQSETNLKTHTREKLIGVWEKVKRWWQK